MTQPAEGITTIMGTPQNDQALRVLEYLYDNSNDHTAGVLDLQDELGYENLLQTIESLSGQGLIRSDGRNGHDLTADGQREVEAMLARRMDRGLRRRLCRDLLLAWIDDRGASHAGARASREDFDAAPDLLSFTDRESEAAAEYLKQQGFIESMSAGQGDHILVWTTDLGRQCIDEGGNVASFTSKDSTPTGGQVFNIYGSGNNFAAAIGDDNQVTASLSTFNHAQAVEFAEAVRDAMPSLTPQGVDPDEVARYVADIEQRQDPTRAQRATALLHRVIESTTTGTLGGILATLGAAALGIA